MTLRGMQIILSCLAVSWLLGMLLLGLWWRFQLMHWHGLTYRHILKYYGWSGLWNQLCYDWQNWEVLIRRTK